MEIIEFFNIPYFFGYKTEFFPSKNNSKNLDPSFKMDLDLRRCVGRVKLVSYRAKFHKTGLAICSHSGEGKTCLKPNR